VPRARTLIVAAALAGGLGGWLFAPSAGPLPAHADAAARSTPGFWAWGRAALRPVLGDPAASAEDRTHDRLFVQGSLAGTETAGDWCVGDGRLQACAALRERFDHYLLGLGEVEPAALRALVRRDAVRAHGEVLATQIVDLWDRYWTLRQQAPGVPFDASDRSTWPALLAEQRGVRRRLLGDDWARAFYGDEERDFEALQARLDAGLPKPVDPGAPVAASATERVARYGADAAGRLAAVDDAWADWERRLAGARGEWSRLQQAPELSAPARQDAIARYLAANFQGDEMMRVRALLRL
jgi:lipase chaperone LimK